MTLRTKHRTYGARLHLGAAVAMSLLVLGMSSLQVQGASSIAQGFATEDPGIVSGALVSLKAGTANSVELGNAENVDRILGIAGENSLIELSKSEGTVQVVTTGEAVALVSDLNGEVKAGDKITASPIAGVGMKATMNTMTIGTAQVDLASVDTHTNTVTDKAGDTRTVRIGAVPIQVDKVFYQAPGGGIGSYVPQALQDFADSLAGRAVSPMRVVVASLLTIIVFTLVAVLLYSSVRSSIISIGRNPLSEKSINKGLLQVGLTVFGLMVFTVIVIYAILTT